MVTSVSELKILEGIKGRVGLNLCRGVVLLHRPPPHPLAFITHKLAGPDGWIGIPTSCQLVILMFMCVRQLNGCAHLPHDAKRDHQFWTNNKND